MKGARMIGLLALVAAAPLAAQQPPKPDSMRPGMMQGMMGEGMMPGMMGPGMMSHMMEMQGMMGPMMRGMAFAPDHLLTRKDALGLTAQQVSRLTALRDAAKAAHDAAAAEARKHFEALQPLLGGAAADTAALKQHFQAAHAAMGNAHWTMLRAAAQAKAALTDEQRGRVNGWADAMQMHMGQMMQMQRQRERQQAEHEPQQDRP
ncbi:MAG: Spy/CpxP family protein refolding chaperone [bacterium]